MSSRSLRNEVERTLFTYTPHISSSSVQGEHERLTMVEKLLTRVNPLKLAKMLIIGGCCLLLFSLYLLATATTANLNAKNLFQYWKWKSSKLLMADMHEEPDVLHHLSEENYIDQSAMCLDGEYPEGNPLSSTNPIIKLTFPGPVDDEWPPTSNQSSDDFEKFYVRAINQRYFERIKYSVMRSSCRPRFIVFTCKDSMMCGGFGDRTRGLVGALYLAMATNRIFHINWSKGPANLADYFLINAELYFKDNEKSLRNYLISSYNDKVNQAYQSSMSRMTFLDKADQNKYINYTNRILSDSVDISGPSEFATMKGEYIEINSNSFISIAAIFPNNATALTTRRVQFLEDYYNFTKNNKVALTISAPDLISAALRCILGIPTERLKRSYSSLTAQSAGSVKVFEEMTKFGIQVRTGMTSFEQVKGKIEKKEQQQCFSNFLWQMIANSSVEIKTLSRVITFITSDSDNATNYLVASLTPALRVVTTFGLATHIDKKGQDDDLDWHDIDKPFIDFYALTRMDALLISRSSYGEMAAALSRVPTWRFRKDNEALGHTLCYFYPWKISSLEME